MGFPFLECIRWEGNPFFIVIGISHWIRIRFYMRQFYWRFGLFICVMFLASISVNAQIDYSEVKSVFSIFNRGGKTKIKLTGTLHEAAVMTIVNTGEQVAISELPFEFKVDKKDLPITLKFASSNYTYTTIVVPKKPVDDVGHIYLVKSDVNAPQSQIQYVSSVNNTLLDSDVGRSKEVVLDKSYSINVAPKTNKKSENTFALIIANEEYVSAAKVDMALNDGLAVKEYFQNTLGLSENQIIYCSNATFGGMKKAISKVKMISKAYDKDINLIFYYAGHGIPDNATKDAYLMPVDADGTDVTVCYSLKTLYREFDEMGINQTVVFLDACFSGAKRDGDMVVAARGVAIKPKEAEPIGRTIVFSATSDEEAAYSYKEQQHGLFTYYLLKIIQEKKGDVTLGDMAKYLSTNVKRNSVLINGIVQSPMISAPRGMESEWKNLKLTGGK